MAVGVALFVFVKELLAMEAVENVVSIAAPELDVWFLGLTIDEVVVV